MSHLRLNAEGELEGRQNMATFQPTHLARFMTSFSTRATSHEDLQTIV